MTPMCAFLMSIFTMIYLLLTKMFYRLEDVAFATYFMSAATDILSDSTGDFSPELLVLSTDFVVWFTTIVYCIASVVILRCSVSILRGEAWKRNYFSDKLITTDRTRFKWAFSTLRNQVLICLILPSFGVKKHIYFIVHIASFTLLFALLHLVWVMVIEIPKTNVRYHSQSGKYGKSKFDFRKQGKAADVKKVIQKLNEKKRSSKNSDSKSFDPAIAHLNSIKKRYESHSGEEISSSYHSKVRDFLGAIYRLWNHVYNLKIFTDYRMLRRAYRVLNSDLNGVVEAVIRDIPKTTDFMTRSRISFSTFGISAKFDVNNVEKWCTVAAGLMTSTSIINAGALLLTHFKTYYNKSVAVELSRYFSKLFAEDSIYESHSVQDVVTMWRTLCTDFKSLQKSPLFDKILSVVGLLVSSGLCGTFDIDFKVAGFTIFSESLKKRLIGLSILDMPGLLLETTAYFLETGYLCYTQKSLKPILFSSPEAYEYEIKYLDYYRILPLACDGDWEAAGVTYSGFLQLYDELYLYLHGLHSVLNKGFEKKVIWDRLVALAKSKNDLDRRVNAGVMRKSPFVLAFCGPSSVGKTSIANIINVVAVKACGGTGELSKKITWNENDDYFSNYKADTETIVMDDLCNTKAAFMTSSPLMWLIKFNNNNPEYAVMADLESKGKLAIRPHTLVITTNVEDLMAQVYSNEPVSILRRLDMRVTVAVKPEFALNNGGSGSPMLDPVKATQYVQGLSDADRVFPDMWNLTVQKAVSIKSPAEGKPDQAIFKTIVWEGIILKDVSLRTVADYTAYAAGEHNRTQSKLVSRQTTLHDTIHLCPVCTRLTMSCTCTLCEQSGDEVVDIVEPVPFEHLEVPDLRAEDTDVEPGYYDWFWFLPYRYQLNVAPFLRYVISERFIMDFVRSNWGILIFQVIAVSCSFFLFSHAIWFSFWLILLVVLITIFAFYRMYYYYWIIRMRIQHMRTGARRLATNPLFVTVVTVGTTYLMSCAIGQIIRGVIKILSVFRNATHENHSALSPASEEEYVSRRSEVNCWYPTLPPVKLVNPTHRAKTSTWRDLAGKVPKNCVYVKNGNKVSGGFYIRSHMLVLPSHFVTPVMNLVITPRVVTNGNKHTYTVNTTDTFVYYVPDSDLAILYAPGGTDKYDVTDYLPDEFLTGTSVNSFFYRGQDGKILTERVTATYGVVKTDAAKFRGSEYTFDSLKTFKGLCMGVFVSETKPPNITGFHLGGLTGTGKGASGTLLRHHVALALAYFDAPGVLFPGSSAEVATKMYEKHLGDEPFTLDVPIAPRCPTNFLPEDGIVEVLSACKGAVSNKSSVIVSHISDTVLAITGIARTHGPAPMGPPDVRTWHNWSLGMQGFSTPSIGPAIDEVVRASVDYLKPLMGLFKHVRPLDLPTVINGLDNDKFLNRMPQNTSVGFPLSGKLSTFSIPSDSLPGHLVNWELDPEIMGVYNIYKAKYALGERCYPVFRASLKDEPVKLGKLKVRVFQAAPVALKMILREYFLPIAAHLSMYPLVSECAVGINPFTSEWEEMHNHIIEHGDDRIVAGDYSAYDQRMSATLTSAAFSVMIELASVAGYNCEDLTIMRSVAADVIYPLVAYNGTLVQLFGSNPSGHNLTVYVNSIVNSLISRCAFFKEYPTMPVFRDAVSMMTYGDDDIGSVGSGWSGYNNISKSNYISSIGMVYTPPSKEGEHVKYMNIGEVDFLKRKSTFNEACGRHMGALELSSIYKSLHVRMLSSEISDDSWAGSVVDGAIREMFAHGEESYERFRSQMIQVAGDCGFSPHSLNLSCSYDDMREKIES